MSVLSWVHGFVAGGGASTGSSTTRRRGTAGGTMSTAKASSINVYGQSRKDVLDQSILWGGESPSSTSCIQKSRRLGER